MISILIWLLVVVFHSTTISNILKTQNSKLQALNLVEIRISLGASSGSLCYLWSRCIFFVYYNAPSIFICLTNFYDWQMNAKIHSYIHFLLRIELLYFFNNWFHTKAIYIYINIYRSGQSACPMLIGCAWGCKTSEVRPVFQARIIYVVRKKKNIRSVNFELL